VLDAERPLSSTGEVKFRTAARGLARIAPRPDVLLTSPLHRARATAEIVARAFMHMEPGIETALADQPVDAVVAALGTHPRSATVALVGDEPMLGALLARLLGSPQAERLAFKKGGAALVDLPDGPSGAGRLIWFLNPRVLRTLAAGAGPRPTSPTPNGDRHRRAKP
jgi:phosphohistidine phosphatase